ncbi:MAG: hypothetical protein VXW87_02365 [Pseudomonadota bacterium]|nr:hypothetical protein [Pseudomonadota bacterium]
MKYYLFVLPLLAYGKLSYIINLSISNQTEEALHFDIKSFYTGRRYHCESGKTCLYQWQQNTPFTISIKNIQCGQNKCYLGNSPYYYHTLYSGHPEKNNKLAIQYTFTGHSNIIIDE